MKKRKKKNRKRNRPSTASAANYGKKAGDYETTSYWKPPEGVERFDFEKPGSHRFDVVPFIEQKDHQFAKAGQYYFEQSFYIHTNIGTHRRKVICPAETYGKKCPICEFRATLSSDTEEGKALWKALMPKHRQLWLLWNPDWKFLKAFEISFHLFGKLLKAKIDGGEEDDGYNLFHDPDEGLTVRAHAAQDSFEGNKYFKVDDVEFKERRNDLPDEVIDHGYYPKDWLLPLDYKSIKALFEESDDSDDDEEEDDEESITTETHRKKKRREKKRGEVDLDDVPFDGEDEWKDDDEDEKPKRRPKKKRRRPKDPDRKAVSKSKKKKKRKRSRPE